jgi:hypothetical protein
MLFAFSWKKVCGEHLIFRQAEAMKKKDEGGFALPFQGKKGRTGIKKGSRNKGKESENQKEGRRILIGLMKEKSFDKKK